VRGPGGRIALRSALRDREVQYRQQDRRELRVHPEEPELPLSGGGRPQLRQTPDPVHGAEQSHRASERGAQEIRAGELI